jgi:hypothetical protein
MSAAPLFFGFFLFLVFFLVHALVWRFRRIRKEIWALLIHFLFLPLPLWGSAALLDLGNSGERTAVFLVYFSFALVYLQTYPALKTDIPSFRILLWVEAAGPGGLAIAEIYERIAREGDFRKNKMNELEDDAFVVRRNGAFVLTAAGKILADFFIFYRRFLGLKVGGG